MIIKNQYVRCFA